MAFNEESELQIVRSYAYVSSSHLFISLCPPHELPGPVHRSGCGVRAHGEGEVTDSAEKGDKMKWPVGTRHGIVGADEPVGDVNAVDHVFRGGILLNWPYVLLLVRKIQIYIL